MSVVIKEFKGSSDDLIANEFISLYKKVFAEAPYFESYENKWIFDNVWQYHLLKGCIFLAFDNDLLVGFGCSVGLDKVSEFLPNSSQLDPIFKVKTFLIKEASNYIDINSSIYMSEIAVHPDYRRQGIGSLLVKKRWNWGKNNNYQFYIMRTADNHSNSRSLYEKLEARLLPVIQDVSDHAAIVKSSSQRRVYLFGSL